MYQRKNAYPFVLAATVSVIAISSPAWAQSIANSNAVPGSNTVSGAGNQLEEVVVTARKREEVAQKTPVAITVFSTADIRARQIQGVADLQGNTPSLRIGDSTYDPLSMKIGIRGQQQTDNLLQQDPPVSFYIDGVLQPSSIGGRVTNQFDLQRIEVLKGPQGTLFGRNTPAGAINLITKLPNDDFGGDVEAGAGNYGEYEFDGDVNIPIVDGKAALRVSADYQAHDGFGKNVTYDLDAGSLREQSYRAALKLDPTDRLDIVLRADFQEARGGGGLVHGTYLQPGPGPTAAQLEAIIDYRLGGFTPANFAKALTILNAPADPGNPYSYTSGFATGSAVQTYGGSVTATYEINDDLSFKNISSYRAAKRESDLDGDGTFAKILDAPGTRTRIGQVTEEAQLNGESFDDRLKWVAGIYYYNVRGLDSDSEVVLTSLRVPVQNDYSILTDDSRAAFAQGTFALTDAVNFTGGIRGTEEDKSLDARNTVSGACIVPFVTPGAFCSHDFPTSYGNFSYTAGIDWTIRDGLMVYGKTSRGFRAGGINSRGNAPATFGPEIDTDYEVGLKSDWLDKRLRVNLAAYHTDIKNAQVTVILPTAAGGVTSGIASAGKVQIDGGELEASAIPIDHLTLSGTLSYTYPKYIRYISGGVNLARDSLPVARWQYSLSAQYIYPTTMGDLNLSVDWSWQSALDVYPHQTDSGIIPESLTTQRPYGVLNSRLAFNIADYDVDLVVYGKNLTDKLYITNGFDVPAFGAAVTYYGAPRTYGFQVIKHF